MKKYPSQIIKTLHGRAAAYHLAIDNINNASIVRINRIIKSPATHQNNDNGKCRHQKLILYGILFLLGGPYCKTRTLISPQLDA